LQPPSSPSITGFLIFWFIHFLAVGLFAMLAGICVMRCGKFWLKATRGAERQWTMEEVFFAVLMAVLVGAVFAAFAASATPPADYSG
jgi:H+/Cl- antiporter ClcA